MNILIIRVSAIGDVIHTFPAIFYLKKMLPHAKISWVVQKKAASIVAQQPFIDKLYTLENGFLKPQHWRSTKKIVTDLRKQKWDAILDFQSLLKTSLLYLPLTGKKFGFTKNHAKEGLSCLFTHKKVAPVYRNIIQKNVALASAVVADLQPTMKSCPALHELQNNFSLHITPERQNRVTTWLKSKNITKFILLSPNTTWPSKHWPLEHWKLLLQRFSQQTSPSHTPVLVGEAFGDQAAALADFIRKNNLAIPSLPKWDLLTMAHIIQKSALLIAPDTGLLHLADFLQTNTIGLFGPTLATKHGPFLHPQNIKNVVQIDCPHRYQKKHGEHDCMDRFSPDQLFKIVSRTCD